MEGVATKAGPARPGEPALSVVVPTKGRPGYLRGCLEALARGEYPRERFEVVVVNDGGGAAVERLVSEAAGRLELRLASPRRSGPSAARNAGAAAARGRWVAFTDDDCEPAPGWLSALERALAAHPGDAVGGRTVNGAPQSVGAAASQAVVDALHEQLNRSPGAPRFFASSNLAFPAEELRSLGGFDERLRYAEDRELCERWLRSGRRFVAAPGAVVHHMRTLTVGEFARQHYGYGRGAWAFRRLRGAQAGTAGRNERRRGRGAQADSLGVLRGLTGRALGSSEGHARAAIAAYLALSQIATAAGVAREAVAERQGRGR